MRAPAKPPQRKDKGAEVMEKRGQWERGEGRSEGKREREEGEGREA